MTILLLTAWYPNRRAPSNGVFIEEQVRALRRRHRVIVVAATSEQDQHFFAEGTSDFFVLRVPRFKPVATFLAFPRLVALLKRIHEVTPIDVIHAFISFPTGVLAVAAGWRLSLPVVISECFGPFHVLVQNPLVRWLVRFALRRSTAVIAISSDLRQQISETLHIDREIRIIPCTVDVDRFMPRMTNRREREGAVRCLFIGTLTRTSRVKGFDVLLEAFAKARAGLAARGTDLRLDVAGGGERTAAFERRARELRVVDACRFLGSIDHGRMADVIRSCDFLVLPSRAETFGVVLIEAMACGKPVLATRSGGPNEVVTPETGLLVPPDNVKAFADGLSAMVERFPTFDAKVIADSARQRFSYDAFSSQIEAVYLSLAPS